MWFHTTHCQCITLQASRTLYREHLYVFLLISAENLGEEFTKVSAIQRVPVIDDNGFILGER